MIKLRNGSKRPYINNRPAERSDGAIIGIPEIIQPGKTGDFDEQNRAVKIAAMAGELKPSDAASKKWLESLKAEA